MSLMNSEAKYPIVKRGVFTYAGSVQCGVEIAQTDFRPGSGDYEDPAEIQEDVTGTFYEVRFQAAGGDGRFSSGGGYYESVESAMSYVGSLVSGVRWE
ncbi:MAG: hypothetical protein JWR26_993 [Pedosphaera sp.]|nr:hypothetical protein [Pedosphaera sp.]